MSLCHLIIISMVSKITVRLNTNRSFATPLHDCQIYVARIVVIA